MTLTELFPFEQAEVPFPSLLFISHCKYNDFFSQITLFSSAVRNKEKICCHCSVQSFRWLSLTLAKRKQVFQIKNIAIIFCLFFYSSWKTGLQVLPSNLLVSYQVNTAKTRSFHRSHMSWLSQLQRGLTVAVFLPVDLCTNHLLKHCRVTHVWGVEIWETHVWPFLSLAHHNTTWALRKSLMPQSLIWQRFPNPRISARDPAGVGCSGEDPTAALQYRKEILT